MLLSGPPLKCHVRTDAFQSQREEDTVLIAFTSGSTGQPKATMHFHRDILASCDCFPKSILHMAQDDICIGTPPLAFTFGLGALLIFSMRVGAATVFWKS